MIFAGNPEQYLTIIRLRVEKTSSLARPEHAELARSLFFGKQFAVTSRTP